MIERSLARAQAVDQARVVGSTPRLSVGEGDANQVLCSTHDLAGVGKPVRPDREPKLIWHLCRGANLDQCARKRRIANEAVNGFRAFASPDFANPEDEGTQSDSTIGVHSGPRILRRAIMQASLFTGAYIDLARDMISRSDFDFPPKILRAA